MENVICEVKIFLRSMFVVLCFMCIHTSMLAQSDGWKIGKSDDGKITVQHQFSKRINTNGKEDQVVEYVATTTAPISMAKLVLVLKDVSKHKDFMGQKTSTLVDMISDNEFVVYYFYEGFWPYPSSDIVAKMLYSEDIVHKTVTFTLTAAPTLVGDKGLKRLDYYNLTYSFKDVGNGNVEIRVRSRFTPAVQMPVFMMNSWFPDGPADYIDGLIKLANKI